MMLFQYVSADDGQTLYICPDQVVTVAADTAILNQGDMTGIVTVEGTYYKVLGAAKDIAAKLCACGLKLLAYTTGDGQQEIYLCADQIVAVARDGSILNTDGVTGLMTVAGIYYKVQGTSDDIAQVLVSKTASP